MHGGKTLRQLTRRRVSVVLLVVAIVPVVFLLRAWKAAGERGGQQPAEPFRIAGNVYYVGANDATSFLLTGPEGHILIDGGYPSTAPMIMESIAKLGFDIKDVKVLLNSHAHHDHAGGLAALQQASGASSGPAKRAPPSSLPAVSITARRCCLGEPLGGPGSAVTPACA